MSEPDHKYDEECKAVGDRVDGTWYTAQASMLYTLACSVGGCRGLGDVEAELLKQVAHIEERIADLSDGHSVGAILRSAADIRAMIGRARDTRAYVAAQAEPLLRR